MSVPVSSTHRRIVMGLPAAIWSPRIVATGSAAGVGLDGTSRPGAAVAGVSDPPQEARSGIMEVAASAQCHAEVGIGAL